MRRRAAIIRNPRARHDIAADLLLELARTACPSWDVEVVESLVSGDPWPLAAQAARDGYDAILSCGGDGTLNNVLNGVRESGIDVIVGMIPSGTANVWAREMHIPGDAAGALALLEHGRAVRADLGLARVRGIERRFLLMCSVGLEAAVVAEMERHDRLKDRVAQVAFAIVGAQVLARFRPVRAVVQAGALSTDRSLYTLIAGNTRLYGGVGQLTAEASVDDGLLDVATIEVRQGRAGILDAARVAMRVPRWLRRGHPYERVAQARITPERALPVQVDGESIASCGADAPLELSVEPRAVRLLVPAVPSPLFTQEA